MRLSRLPIAIALAIVAAGCGSLTETSASQILASNLTKPSNAGLLVTSTIADFECAYAQYILASGLVSDELADAQLRAVGWDYDRRTIKSSNDELGTFRCEDGIQSPGLYTPLSIARFQGDNVLRLLNGWTDAQVPNRAQLIGQAAAYTGYVLTFMGETMCSAAIDGGAALKPDSLLGLAEAHFTVAITSATQANDTATVGMATIGRARVRLDRGRLTDAAADAALVTDIAFVKNSTYDAGTTRRENRVYTMMFRDNYASVEAPFQNATFASQPDPRVSVTNAGVVGQDATTIIWRANKYPAIDAPIPIAHYTEAQLIIAENDVATGNVSGAAAIITALHHRALPNDTTTYSNSNPDSVKAQIIVERSREMFLEGHRLSDIIHYGLPLNPPAGTPYVAIKGGQYGSQLCFPLPDVERLNNPNAGGG